MQDRDVLAITQRVENDDHRVACTPAFPLSAYQQIGYEMKFGTTDPAEASALIGTKVFVRTVTMYYTGRVSDLTDRWLVLEDCAWIPDTGRWMQALANGTLSEVEPYPDGAVWIAMSAVLDISQWNHDLPRTQK